MKYLIIDKRQRVSVETMGEIPTGSARIIEELKKKNIDSDFIYNDQLEFIFNEGSFKILADGTDLDQYTHIIFRGHRLDNEKEYHFKRYIVEYAEQSDSKILVQNAEAIKRFPYYNKIAIAILCAKNNLPHFNTYYKTNGEYTAHRDILNEYPLILKEYSGKNRVENIDGNEKIKKNVYKIDNIEDLNNSDIENMKDFFIQEFSNDAQDYRVFVKLGKVIGGWKRKASEGFMTVNKGIYEMYNKPEQEVRDIAEKIASILDADFLAVDFMNIDGKPQIQEISLHPGYKAYETKIEGEPINIAEAITTAFKE